MTEVQFCNALHNKKFSDLSDNLKKFVKFLNGGTEPNGACIIQSDVRTNSLPPNKKYESIVGKNLQKPKRDAVVEFDNKKMKISLKSGASNSSHQEIWARFEKLLRLFGATDSEF